MAADGALLRPLQPTFPLFLLLLLLLFFCSLPPSSLQTFPQDFLFPFYRTCSLNATLSPNLDTALSNFRTLASGGTNYSNTTAGRSGQDIVYAVFQCTGDLSTQSCSVCLQSAAATARPPQDGCPYTVGAYIKLDACLLEYAFFVPDTSVLVDLCSTKKTTAEESLTAIQDLMDNVINNALLNIAFGRDGENYGNNPDKAWVMAQCSGGINESECSRCLSTASSIRFCNLTEGKGLYWGSCFYRDDLRFLETPSHGRGWKTPVIVVGVIGAVNSVIAILMLCYKASKIKGWKTPITVVGVIGAVTSVIAILMLRYKASKIKGWKTPVIVVDVIGAVTSVIAILMFRYKASKIKALALSGLTVYEADLLPTNAKVFSLKELRRATGNFNPTNKIGQGGFGIVYKGTLSDGQEVAIKKLIIGSQAGNQGFLNEVQLITSVRHKNIVRLLGCCVEDSQRILVYEYIPNKSLDFFLFGEAGERTSLDWSTRYGIIVGMAKGLAYLHEECFIRIIHRDIKPSNILLDDGLNPVIADFGIARLVEANATHVKTGVAGTIGYLAPEYAIHGDLSERVDVFSFGLVCLEIIAGKHNTNGRLLRWAWEKHQIGRLVDLVDEKLGDAFSTEQAIRAVHVALLCTQENPKQRPVMSTVTSWLLGMADNLEIPTVPTFLIYNESRSPFICPQSYSEKDSLKSGGVLSSIEITEAR